MTIEAVRYQSGEVVTTRGAAEILQRKPQTLRRWRMQGGGPRYIRAGELLTARVLYRIGDLEAWLESHVAGNTAEEAVRLAEEATRDSRG